MNVQIFFWLFSQHNDDSYSSTCKIWLKYMDENALYIFDQFTVCNKSEDEINSTQCTMTNINVLQQDFLISLLFTVQQY